MRPLLLEYPQSPEFFDDDHEFLFGHDLFVSPVTTELLDTKVIQLPPGSWYDYWTGEKTHGSRIEKTESRVGSVCRFTCAPARLFRASRWCKTLAKRPMVRSNCAFIPDWTAKARSMRTTGIP